jgi:hypothetical protein
LGDEHAQVGRVRPRIHLGDEQDLHGARKLDASVTPASPTRALFGDTLASGRRLGEPS